MTLVPSLPAPLQGWAGFCPILVRARLDEDEEEKEAYVLLQPNSSWGLETRNYEVFCKREETKLKQKRFSFREHAVYTMQKLTCRSIIQTMTLSGRDTDIFSTGVADYLTKPCMSSKCRSGRYFRHGRQEANIRSGKPRMGTLKALSSNLTGGQ